MSKGAMKSELIGKSKAKIEARPPIHHRRMSKSSPVYGNHENGVVVIQDGLLSTAISPRPLGNEEVSSTHDGKNNGISCPSDSAFDSEVSSTAVNDLKNALNKVSASALPGQSSNDKELEVANLKDLLILNLDLIQHQQQLLIARDRQIKTLAAEKDAVSCFLFLLTV